MTRRSAVLGAGLSLVLVLLAAAPALAGGWAEIKADQTRTSEPPVAGRPLEIGFTVLQHGVTPAGWVHPTIHLTDLATGEAIDVAASSSGVDGHFLVSVTPPTAGFWSWTVTLTELVVDPAPVTITVHNRDGAAPAFDPATLIAAIARARNEVSQSLGEDLYPQLERIDGAVRFEGTRTDRLAVKVTAIADERDALAARLATVEATVEATAGKESLPVLGIVLLAVLAGAAAGFAMAWLGGRSAPREVVLNPAPRESTPA